jgi:hypothetical protein
MAETSEGTRAERMRPWKGHEQNPKTLDIDTNIWFQDVVDPCEV